MVHPETVSQATSTKRKALLLNALDGLDQESPLKQWA